MYNISKFARNMAGPNFGISPMLLTNGGQKQVMLHEKSVLRPFGPEFLE